ncbi:S24 family peptidase [Bordetella petrii]|uniref:S24 family peptidase n=1 Tax=Bordetella petrii TaxID=94624 RepID=UPI00047AD697|nr:S24 family peptidase [Bordetella petrii]
MKSIKEIRKENFAKAIDEKCGGNQSLAAEELGYSTPSLVSRYATGAKDIGDKAARKMETVFGYPRNWMDSDHRAEADEAQAGLTPLSVNSISSVTISQYDTGGRMGAAGVELRDQPGVIESWRVSREWLEKNVRGYSQLHSLCIVTGFGDSMRPMFNPGDPLIIDSSVRSVEFDAVYFFRVGNEGFIKRLQRVPGKGLLAISENPAYRDWVIDPTMDLEVFGRVLKVWRSEDF